MPYKTWLLAGFLVLVPWAVHAAGLGKLTILSALGRPLIAEIDLVSVRNDEIATLTARLATPEAFAQANIQYSAALVGLRMSIERRANGSSYIKVISTRPINDPFLDLLVELSWAQGRLVREYTALIDPPGYTPNAPFAQAAPSGTVARIVRPGSRQDEFDAPDEDERGARAPAGRRRAAGPARTQSREYGPVRRGETLFSIASRVKPEGVTLSQMLASLYRSNPNAFAGNMNNLKTGTILRVPGRQQVAATGQSTATREVRVQAGQWNTYRQKLADAAGETPARESQSAASGKITTTIDRAAGRDAPREVLKLSKGEPAPGKAGSGKGAAGTAAERKQLLEEDATARKQAIAEGSDRIAQLEKNITDMQRLLEVKGQLPVAPGAKPVPQPVPEAKPELIPPMKGSQVAVAEPAKTEPAKAGPAKAEPAKKEPAKAAAAAEPDLVDRLLDIFYVAAGGGLVALTGAGAGYYWFVRR
ncbi:MAG: FimV/HubP family polar landmark protein, partial [Sulfuricaulis sp.]|nr:FimV/HubP family polar landmark protein [Sulfuricaulis sp.]